jgi:hypothetical protein
MSSGKDQLQLGLRREELHVLTVGDFCHDRCSVPLRFYLRQRNVNAPKLPQETLF